MKHDENGFYHHKVGYVHYNGTILADALKYDESGNTVSLYKKTYNDGEVVYNVTEWDKNGQAEIDINKYDNYDEALQRYIYLAFNVSM